MPKRTLTVEILGDPSSLSRAFKKASSDTDREMGKLQGSVKKHSLGISKSLVGAAAGFAGVAGAITEIKDSVSTVETLAKGTAMLSRTTGFDAKQSSEWVTVAKTRNVEAKQLNMGFVALARNIKSASTGTKASVAAFKELGISQAEVRRGNTSEIIRDVSDAFAKMPDGANKAALAQKLFARQAGTLLPLLNKGSGELQKQLGVVDKYGATLDKAGVKKANEAVQAQREMQIAWQGVQIFIGQKLIPIVTKAAQGFSSFILWARKTVGPASSFGKSWREAAASVGAAVGRMVAGVKRFLAGHRTDIKTAQQATQNLGKAAKYVFETIILPTVRTAIKRIGPILQNFIGALSGVIRFITNTLTGKWGKAWDALKDALKNAFQGMGRIALASIETLGGLALRVGKAIGGGILKGLGSIGHAIFEKVKAGVVWAGKQIGSFIDKANPFSSITGNIVGGSGDGLGHKIAAGLIGSGGLPTGGAFGGNLMGARPTLRPVAEVGSRFGLQVSSGRRPGAITSSGNVSYHSSGEAIDEAGSPAGMMAFFKTMRSRYGSRLAELIYTPGGVGIKDGRPFKYTGAVAADHFDHVHVAVDSGRPGVGDGLGKFRATSYGPPWGGIQGGGITASGVNLSNAPHRYGVAVDPDVIPLGSKLRITPNPFGYGGLFTAFDTGGAIKGNRIDFYDWRGRAAQNNWGSRSVTVSTAGKASRRKGSRKKLYSGPRTGTAGGSVGGLSENMTVSGIQQSRDNVSMGGDGPAPYDEPAAGPTTLDFLDAGLAKAEGTSTKADDLYFLRLILGERQRLLGEAKKTNDPRLIAAAQREVNSVADAIKGLTDAVTLQTETQQRLIDSNKELRAELKTHNDFAKSVTGITSREAIRALADTISGGIYGPLQGRRHTAGNGTVAVMPRG